MSTSEGTFAQLHRWGPIGESVCSARLSVSVAERMLFHMFQICLIVYVNSLLNSTSYKVLTVKFQVLMKRVLMASASHCATSWQRVKLQISQSE